MKSNRYGVKLYHISFSTTMFRLLVMSVNHFNGTFVTTKFMI